MGRSAKDDFMFLAGLFSYYVDGKRLPQNDSIVLMQALDEAMNVIGEQVSKEEREKAFASDCEPPEN
jgi:hypothetical protein